MTPIRRILLIVSPAVANSAAVHRATALAGALGAELWLGLFDRGPQLATWGVLDAAEARSIEAELRDQTSRDLETLASRLRQEHRLQVRTLDVRERASGPRILGAVRDEAIDLVIKDVGHSTVLRRLIHLPLDWELLRESPVPVWLCGHGEQGLPRLVAAAVDPVHPAHGAGALNDAILDVARTVGAPGTSSLRVYSAFDALPAAMPALDPVGAGVAFSNEELYEKLRADHRQALEALVARHGLAANTARILYGTPVDRLLEALEQDRPDVLVVGTLRRRGLDRLFMGSTAERLLAEAPCDVLAVPVAAPDGI